nr:FabD/lysophospholipase-like protein [Penicillium herquei]
MIPGIDGGGVRSLSSLLILDEIVRQYNTARGTARDPGEIFDVAFGTSGGGLSALMIKKLAMTMEDSLTSLEVVSRTVFRQRAFNPGRFQGGFLRWPRYNQRLLAEQIQSITGMAQMQGPPACNW